MTLAGMALMIIFNLGVISLLSWCLYKVLTLPHIEETEHAPLEIDTRDLND